MPAAAAERKASPTQERILAAATKCFRRLGVAGTTMGDIADELAMQRPHLYRHFASKEALIATVIVREARALSRRRLSEFTLEGPAAELFVEVLARGQRRLARDDFMGQVMAGSSGGLIVRLLADDPAFLEAETEWWGPALVYGRERGEIRSDLADDEIVRWFLISQMSIAERPALFADDRTVREHLTKFVVPAVLSARS